VPFKLDAIVRWIASDVSPTSPFTLFPPVSSLRMSRDANLALVREYTQNESLVRHMLAVEAAMLAYARKFGENEEEWGAVGLLHDFDYERWPDPPDHPLRGA
jgi:predicted hydrolase (HD superfamily)